MLRGSHSAKIDDKGRLKLPTAYRAIIEEQHGSALYVTSVEGNCVEVYPLPVWEALEQRLSRLATTNSTRRRYLERVSYFGQAGEFDAQGRVSIPPRLREVAGMTGAVDVLGQMDHLQIWNHDRLMARFRGDPFTEDDEKVLSEAGV